MSTSTDYVVFENSQGEEISNDPRWRAEKTLREAGVEVNAQRPVGDPDDMEVDTSDYAGMKAAQLVKIAKERGVDIKGLKKVGEVRAALEKADEAEAQQAAGDDDDEDNDQTQDD